MLLLCRICAVIKYKERHKLDFKIECHWAESHRRPPDYESGDLTADLQWPLTGFPANGTCALWALFDLQACPNDPAKIKFPRVLFRFSEKGLTRFALFFHERFCISKRVPTLTADLQWRYKKVASRKVLICAFRASQDSIL